MRLRLFSFIVCFAFPYFVYSFRVLRSNPSLSSLNIIRNAKRTHSLIKAMVRNGLDRSPLEAQARISPLTLIVRPVVGLSIFQIFYLLYLLAGSSDLWVPSSSCNSPVCASKHKYNSNASSTSEAKKGKFAIEYGDGSHVSGPIFTDTGEFTLASWQRY